MYNKNWTIYYTTGTGNSYRVSTWIHDLALSSGAETLLQPIEKAVPQNAIEAGHSLLVILYFILTVPFAAYTFSL
jgi:hypothetical protein